MDRETAQRMVAFADEIEKTSGIWDAFKSARKTGLVRTGVRAVREGLKGKHTRQLMVGAGIGGVTGALAAPEGEGARGALIGAGVGAGAAGARILATPSERKILGQNVRNFGKRQWHFLTGSKPSSVAEAERLKIIPARPSQKEMLEAKTKAGVTDLKEAKKIQKKHDAAMARHKLHVEAYRKGETSIPGAFRSMVTHPIDFTRRAWKRQDMPGKIFTGLSGVMAGRELMRKGEPGEEGRFARTGSEIGTGLGFLAVPHGLLPGLAVSYLGSKAGKYMGKGVDVLAGTKPPPAPVTSPGQLAQPPETGGA